MIPTTTPIPRAGYLPVLPQLPPEETSSCVAELRRWNRRRLHRRMGVAALVALVAAAALFAILAANVHAAAAVATDHELGFNALPVAAWLMVGLVTAFVAWQFRASWPILFPPHNSPEDRLSHNWKHFNHGK